ncbi:MAG: type II toxin-antitoxin system HicA family toxin [Patescibacteria group bacterium]
MPKLPQIKTKIILRVLQKEGFMKRPGKGSHIVLAHSDGRRTVVPFHNKPLAKGTLRAILRQANISLEEFLHLLKEKS